MPAAPSSRSSRVTSATRRETPVGRTVKAGSPRAVGLRMIRACLTGAGQSLSPGASWTRGCRCSAAVGGQDLSYLSGCFGLSGSAPTRSRRRRGRTSAGAKRLRGCRRRGALAARRRTPHGLSFVAVVDNAPQLPSVSTPPVTIPGVSTPPVPFTGGVQPVGSGATVPVAEYLGGARTRTMRWT